MSDIGYKVLDRIYSVRGVKRYKLISSRDVAGFITLTFVEEIEYNQTTKYLHQLIIDSGDDIVIDVSIPESDLLAAMEF